MKQERVQRQKTRASETHTEESNPGVTTNEVSEKAGQTVEEIDELLEDQADDDLLADIDDILERDAEEFVAAYVQQGGE